MTKDTFKITIKTPCSENWETMIPNEEGNHCLSCRKTVVDFTSMTDSQIIHYFQNYKGKTCGRFLETQVNRPILPPLSPKNHTRWAWLFSVLILPMSAKAQEVTKFDIEQVSKDILEIKNKEDTPHKVKVSKKKKEEKVKIINQLECFTMGDAILAEPQPIPLKSSSEILQGIFTSFKSLIMNVLSFFKSL